MQKPCGSLFDTAEEYQGGQCSKSRMNGEGSNIIRSKFIEAIGPDRIEVLVSISSYLAPLGCLVEMGLIILPSHGPGKYSR